MARERKGKRERQAGKRHRRVMVVKSGGMTLQADFRYFMRYPEAESLPLKVGHRHAMRGDLSPRRWAIDEKPGAGLARSSDA